MRCAVAITRALGRKFTEVRGFLLNEARAKVCLCFKWLQRKALLLKRFLLLFVLWLVLTGSDPDAIIPGFGAAALAVSVTRKLPPERYRISLSGGLAFLPGFVWRSFRAGIDVAWRALHPQMPLNPGWIAYSCRLPPGLPRTMLGGAVSLLPGTLAAGGGKDNMLVHCLDRNAAVARQINDEEKRVQKVVRP